MARQLLSLFFIFGSRTSRKPSPSRLNAMTTNTIDKPGTGQHGVIHNIVAPIIQHRSPLRRRRLCAKTEEGQAAGGQDSDGNPRVACTMIGDVIFGKICPKMIRPSLAPSERMASIYSSLRTASVEPRTTLAKVGIEKMLTAMITLNRFFQGR